jgi:hypothetical protein
MNFASATAPLDIGVVDVCSGDVATEGYVEVVEACSLNLGNPPVSKSLIKGVYDAWVAQGLAAPTTVLYNATTYNVNLPINVLTAVEEITNTLVSSSFSLNATVMKNYDSTDLMAVAVETKLGINANNTITEVEAALAKNNLAIPYYTGSLGFTLSVITFPTKLAGFPCGVNNWLGTYTGFPDVFYTLTAFDLEENTVVITLDFSPPVITTNFFSYEVNTILASDFSTAIGSFEEGWMLIALDNGPTTGSTLSCPACGNITYTDAPAISSAMRFNTNSQGGWQYSAYDSGAVTVNGTAEVQYPYFMQTDNTTSWISH